MEDENFPIRKIYEGNAGNPEEVGILEEIMDAEIYFDREEQHELNSINESVHEEEIQGGISSEYNWMVEAEPQQLDQSTSYINCMNKTVQVIEPAPEENERPMFDEMPEASTLEKVCEPSITESNEEMNEDVGNIISSDCNWVVERTDPQQLERPISQSTDFVDFPCVFNQIIKLGSHSSIGCCVEHFTIVGSQQNELEKVYNVQCQMCNYKERIPCPQNYDSIMDINRSAVSATMVTGGGFNQLEDLMSGMNVSCMSKKMYEKCQDEVIHAFEVAALREMEEAGTEGKELAIARGDVHQDSNIPCVPVVADGSWMK